MLAGRPLFSPDRKHIHHRLLDMGFTHRQAVVILYCVSAASVAVSLFFLPRFGFASVAASGLGSVFLILGVRQLGYQEFQGISSIGMAMQRCRRCLFFNLNIRKTVAKLRDAGNPMQLVEILETCLWQDFSGFELTLSPRFCTAELRGISQNGVFRRFWGPMNLRSEGLTIDLATSNGGPIGSFLLYGNRNAPLLTSTDGLAGELGGALSVTLARLLKPAVGEGERIPELVRVRSEGFDESCDTARRSLAATSTFSER